VARHGGGLSVGIRIPPFEAANRLVSHVIESERLGFDQVWFPDSQLLWRDVFSVLAIAAAGTERIGLGTAVTNVATRHPSVIASAARTINEIAPGRFSLGLGAGNSSLGPIGLRPSTQAEIRSAVDMVRTLLDGREWEFGSLRSRLRDPSPGVPIHLAATGPRNLALAGEIADGVIVLSGVSTRSLTRAAALIAAGAERAGKSSVPELTVSAYCHITDDVERDAIRLKPICAAIKQNGGTEFLRSVGIDIDVPQHVEGVYPDLVHAEDWAAAVAACSQWVTDADAVTFARSFCLFGTADEVLAGLRRARDAGASGVFLQHVGSYDPPQQLMHDVAEQVLPRLTEIDQPLEVQAPQ
jgi:5,10-methylenetetrahydromethanopterin reductase